MMLLRRDTRTGGSGLEEPTDPTPPQEMTQQQVLDEQSSLEDDVHGNTISSAGERNPFSSQRHS